MTIMCADVEYICFPSRVPCLCVEKVDGQNGAELHRMYYRWVTPRTWWELRKVYYRSV